MTNPAPAPPVVHIDLWLHDGDAPTSPNEMTVHSFVFKGE
jgi:hypothetical protein